ARATSSLSAAPFNATVALRSGSGGNMPQPATAKQAASVAPAIVRRHDRMRPESREDTMMKRLLPIALIALAPALSFAALDVGDHAPDFAIPAALDGNEYKISLADAHNTALTPSPEHENPLPYFTTPQDGNLPP